MTSKRITSALLGVALALASCAAPKADVTGGLPRQRVRIDVNGGQPRQAVKIDVTITPIQDPKSTVAQPKPAVAEPKSSVAKAQGRLPKQETAPKQNRTNPVNDSIRMPDMLALPTEGDFRSSNPTPPSSGAVISRPPTDSQAR